MGGWVSGWTDGWWMVVDGCVHAWVGSGWMTDGWMEGREKERMTFKAKSVPAV